MDALMLCYRDEPLREFLLEGRPIEIGSGAGCDIVVHDPEVAERELVVWHREGVPVIYDFAKGDRRDRRPRALALGEPIPVGRHHSLVRVASSPRTLRATPCTEPMQPIRGETLGEAAPLVLMVGHGAGARRVGVDGWPMVIGTGPASDVVLCDRAVSSRHCRVEARRGGVLVRDLGSRNGTWVDGIRVHSARVSPGSVIRIGRTDLSVVARGRPGDGRSAGVVAASPAMLGVLGEVERLARLSWPVLVEGESGAGKEGIARALHERGSRSRGPFVAVNAGGLPRELVESELFGHEKGAFTGASSQHRGVFEQADSGTLFLDEVGELPLDLQARLLRVLETWMVRRVGAETPRPVDVRLVCATHRDLRTMVSLGTFRRDLYYRMTRLVVTVPPLRERPEDVRALSDHFLAEVSGEVGPRALTEGAMARLLAHDWPGNARELKNVLCAAAATVGGEQIEAADVEQALLRVAGPQAARGKTDLTANEALAAVVDRHGGNLASAARALGMPRSTLRGRIRSVQPAPEEAAQGMRKPA